MVSLSDFKIFAFLALLTLLFGCISQNSGIAHDMPEMRGDAMTGGNNELSNPIERSVNGLPDAKDSKPVEIPGGQHFSLSAYPVTKEISGNKIRMYAYNGQIPGPIIKVRQGSSIYVNFTNEMEYETTVHWHGLRLENKYDGVPYVTQQPVKTGGSFLYKLDFPDAGIYWYHPHVREDMQQELGLYGVIIVEPSVSGYYRNVSQEEVLVLDDILFSGKDVYPYDGKKENFALMGRFGNEMLVNGMQNYSLTVKKGETIRFYVLNAANVRMFNLSIEDTALVLVGGDNGKYADGFGASSIVISPSERQIIEAVFDKAGIYGILSKTPDGKRVLGTINVEENNQSGGNPVQSVESTNTNNELKAYLERNKTYLDTAPDFDYILTVDFAGMMAGMGGEGMREMMMHNDGGTEWEDGMFAMNSFSTNESVMWVIKDKKTGKKNMETVQRVSVSKQFKVRITNDANSMHPMQHSIHLHGARFVVLKSDGKTNPNPAWKDTVNIPAGGSVEILAEFEHEGEWMMHCHIAEHLGAGMMASFIAR